MANGGGRLGDTVGRRAGGRVVVSALALVAVVLAGAFLGTLPAVAQTGAPEAEADFTARIAAERRSAGRAPLAVEDDLVAVARRHSATMAAQNRLYHNPQLGEHVQGWTLVGENVGMGAGVDIVHATLMASPGHRAEILDPAFDGLGVGVVQSNGVVWVTQVFRQRAGGPANVPAPAPALAPVVRAATAAVAPRPAPPPPPTTTAATTTTVAPTTTTTPAPPTTTAAPVSLRTAGAAVEPPAVDLAALPVAVSAPLPLRSGLVALGTLAAALLWSVVAGLARLALAPRFPLLLR